MSAQHYFKVPFGQSGDLTPVPDAAVPAGDVSYTEGFGPDYELNPASDPDAKRIPRDKFNQLLYDITTNLQQYQLTGVPEWVTPAQNGGVAISYPLGAMVRHLGVLYGSIVAANTAEPGTDAAKWRLDEAFSLTALLASVAEMNAASTNGKFVSPGRLAVAIREGRLTYAGVVGGTATAYTLTVAGATIAQGVGTAVEFTVPSANVAGPITLKVNALATLPLQTSTEGVLAANDLQPGRVYRAISTGTKWLIQAALPSQQGGGVPVGTVAHCATAAAPDGWLIRDGSAVSRTTYSALFAAISTTFGTGDGSTTFNLPDDRGLFDRGLDLSAGIDPSRVLGSIQSDAFAQHQHTINVGNNTGSGDGPQVEGTNAPQTSLAASSFAGTATETRPKNRAYTPIIKY